MNRIYAPWRHDYVTKTVKQEHKADLHNNCVFCDKFIQQDDEKSYILKRIKHTVIIMNLYPYNGGHLMVVPLAHESALEDLTSEARIELIEVTSMTAQLVKKVTKCEGMNIGLNLGNAGGGGIKEHIHMHVLPRWRGDTNFLVTLADTSLICTEFNEVYKELKAEFDASFDTSLFLK